MKKRISIMAGLLAMALVGSAQAATMFAVQNSGGVDQATISDTGAINTGGHITTNNPSAAGGWLGIGTATPGGPVHFKGAGASATEAGFIYEFVSTGATPFAFTAPNFFFTRNNDTAVNGGYPRTNDYFGSISFGDIKSGSRISSVVIAARAEANGTATFTPSYITFTTTDTSGVAGARMRITSGGNIGIGTNAPTSKLHVVGLPTYADNAAALLGGLTAGAFYKTATGVLMVVF